VPVEHDFAVSEGRRFGAIVEALGESPVAIVRVPGAGRLV
jgi:hypothetical protein